MMSTQVLMAAIAAAVVATIGLWWFRLVLSSIRKKAKTTRYGVYAVIWLAYFIVTMMVISQSQQ